MSLTLSPKIEALFRAVDQLMSSGADINSITVSQITTLAGIGKGTAYEYFTNKEELIAGALLYKLSSICLEIQEEMESKSRLYGKVSYLLDA
ncbi:MAG: TetR/AcrR family transcriptional regulator, partial [Lachnospiraceae bacterium]|nr:TetR/AcrR family transcriptional regulator [Lachnospiraceae bacterium]